MLVLVPYVFLLDNENVKSKETKVSSISPMKAYLEPKEIERIEHAAEYICNKRLVRSLSHLGCHVSEALGITVSAIYFEQNTVTIIHLKNRIKLSCPRCRVRLSRTARLCPGFGITIEKAIAEDKERLLNTVFGNRLMFMRLL